MDEARRFWFWRHSPDERCGCTRSHVAYSSGSSELGMWWMAGAGACVSATRLVRVWWMVSPPLERGRGDRNPARARSVPRGAPFNFKRRARKVRDPTRCCLWYPSAERGRRVRLPALLPMVGHTLAEPRAWSNAFSYPNCPNPHVQRLPRIPADGTRPASTIP